MFKLKPSATPYILTALGAVPFLAAALAMLFHKNDQCRRPMAECVCSGDCQLSWRRPVGR